MTTPLKIRELIEQNKILDQRNEELRNLINSNLPTNRLMVQPSLNDYIDISEAESLIVKFYQYNKIPTVLYDHHGKALFTIGLKRFCTQLGIVSSDCHKKCTEGFKHFSLFKEPLIHIKCNNGISTIALPIFIHEKHIGTIALSQFITETKLSAKVKSESLAKSMGVDEEKYLEVIDTFPHYSETEIEQIVQNASFLSEMIAYVGTKSLETYHHSVFQANTETVMSALRDKLNEQDHIIKSLIKNINQHLEDLKSNTISKQVFDKRQQYFKRSEEILNNLITSIPIGIAIIHNGIFTFANDQMYRITGYTIKELIGHTLEDVFKPLTETEIFEWGISGISIFREELSFEALVLRKDGKCTEALIYSSIPLDSEDEKDRIISVMDLSSIKEKIIKKNGKRLE